MTKKVKTRSSVADPDDMMITDEMFARAKRRDDLPAEIERLLPRRRGPGKKKLAKVSLTLRVSRPAVEAFRATGDGWQTRMNDALERAAKRLVAN
jgi:uncharacterized protein (DUF4415 family)